MNNRYLITQKATTTKKYIHTYIFLIKVYKWKNEFCTEIKILLYDIERSNGIIFEHN